MIDSASMREAKRGPAPSRRTVIAGVGVAGLGALMGPMTALPAFAQAPGNRPPPTPEEIAAALPVKATGLEHVSITVPDAGAAARFYSKVFNPDGLRKEQQGDLRYYVDLHGGYIAIGAPALPPPPFIDHFCALAEDYNPAAVAARVQADGLGGASQGAGGAGLLPDPNGIGLQLLPVPGGWAPTTEPTTRLVNGEAIVTPTGLAHVLLLVDDVEETLAFYARFFDGAVERQSDPDRAWIQIAGTRLGLQRRAPIEPARIDEFAVKVAAFDPAAVSADLRAAGAIVAPPSDGGVLRFRDPLGLGVALVPA